LLPFIAAVDEGFPLLMSAHLQVNAWDNALPGTFSRRICTELLRDELGFEGVLVSDDMEMGAVVDNYAMADAALMAMEAGVDLLLICHRFDRQQEAFEALLKTAEVDSTFRQRLEIAASRIRGLKTAVKPVSPVLPGDLRPRLAALRQEASDIGLS
jgi:beta-N-acetylhexosaminidase